MIGTDLLAFARRMAAAFSTNRNCDPDAIESAACWAVAIASRTAPQNDPWGYLGLACRREMVRTARQERRAKLACVPDKKYSPTGLVLSEVDDIILYRVIHGMTWNECGKKIGVCDRQARTRYKVAVEKMRTQYT